MKLLKENETTYFYECPGCGSNHGIYLHKWQFNGDMENPTVRPSIVSQYEEGKTCHSFITDGKIQFLEDCSHENAGKTLEMFLVE